MRGDYCSCLVCLLSVCHSSFFSVCLHLQSTTLMGFFSWIFTCGFLKNPSFQKLWCEEANMLISFRSLSMAFAHIFWDQRSMSTTGEPSIAQQRQMAIKIDSTQQVVGAGQSRAWNAVIDTCMRCLQISYSTNSTESNSFIYAKGSAWSCFH